MFHFVLIPGSQDGGGVGTPRAAAAAATAAVAGCRAAGPGRVAAAGPGNNQSQRYDVENRWRISQRTVENGNLDNLPDQQRVGTVSVRIMVHEWPLASSSDLKLIVIQEEVTEIDGKQVQQEEVTEIDILVKDLRVLRHSNYTVPLKESMLYSIPRDNDMLFTLPNLSGKDIQDPLQTTSQYLIRQVETTVDEETLPGKLPETPLRIEPPSSYKVMCQWVEDLRKGLCRFWFRSLPIFFSLMEVIVVGVVGAALILKVLKVIFPSCENKGILLLDQVSFVPVITISLPSDLPDRKDNLDEKACT
ncbi:glycoprotein integral membrane protein 1 isoform 2-T2 [Theristicus caerulescens]